jgi:hypothetical protein
MTQRATNRGNAKSSLTSVKEYNRLGGVVVSVLAPGPKGRGFEPSQVNGFLRAIKIRSTPSFRVGNKAGGPMS